MLGLESLKFTIFSKFILTFYNYWWGLGLKVWKISLLSVKEVLSENLKMSFWLTKQMCISILTHPENKTYFVCNTYCEKYIYLFDEQSDGGC